MTEEQFFEELTKLRGAAWYITNWGHIRLRRGSLCLCPIEVLAVLLHDTSHITTMMAANILKLPRDVTGQIIRAADNKQTTERSDLFRERLLLACGLEEAA